MDIKSIFASKTFWGLAFIAASHFVPRLAILSADEQNAIVQHVMEFVGFALALYGRLTAKTTLTLTGK